MAPRTPLVDPRAYFERDDRPTLARGFGVVLVSAVLTAIGSWLFVRELLRGIDISAATRRAAPGELFGSVVVAFIAVLLSWLILGAVMHVLLWLGDPERGIASTMAVIGVAELVTIALFPVSLAGLLILAGQVPADPNEALRFMQEANRAQSPLLLLTSLVGLGWGAWIQGTGFAAVHGVSRSHAYAITFGVGGLFWLIGFF